MQRLNHKTTDGSAAVSCMDEEWRDVGLAERCERQARLAARLGLPRFAIRLLGERRAKELAGRV